MVPRATHGDLGHGREWLSASRRNVENRVEQLVLAAGTSAADQARCMQDLRPHADGI